MRKLQTELFDELRMITSSLLFKPNNLFDYARFIEHIKYSEAQQPIIIFKKKKMENMTSTIYKFDPKQIRQFDLEAQNEIQIQNHNMEANI